MKFRLIPPGEFTMGLSNEEVQTVVALNPGDPSRQDWTRSSAPEHRVRLTQAFYIGVYEVTQEQYIKVMGVNPSHFSSDGGGKEQVAGEDTSRHPVETVSFIDAAEFCSKLRKQEQREPVGLSANNVAVRQAAEDGYRLPTEAEWEFACRGGTNTAWFHGEQESVVGTLEWVFGNSGGRTHIVGQLGGNPFGLYDLHGNVWELCQDWYDPQAYSQRGAGPTVDPLGPDSGLTRVIRGGRWNDRTSNSRSGLRAARTPDARDTDNGFRLCVSVDAARRLISLPGPALPKP